MPEQDYLRKFLDGILEEIQIPGWMAALGENEETVVWKSKDLLLQLEATPDLQDRCLSVWVEDLHELMDLDSYDEVAEWTGNLTKDLIEYKSRMYSIVDRAEGQYLKRHPKRRGPAFPKPEISDEQLQNLMDKDAENEHILIARERKLAASHIEDAIEGHGLKFVLSTIARICEIHGEEGATGAVFWSEIGKLIASVSGLVPKEIDE